MTFTRSTSVSSRFSPPRAPAVSLAALVLALAACGSSGPGGSSNGNILMADANNYTSSSTLNVPVVQTASGTDLSISWNGITNDLLCHPVQSIDNVAFLKVTNMSQAMIMDALAKGTLSSNQVSKYYEWHTQGATSTMLSALKFGGAIDVANDYVEGTSTQYVLLVTHGTVQGIGAQSMVLLQPTASSTNTTVVVPDACTAKVLSSFDVTFGTALTPPKAGPYKVDWSKLTHDSFGNPIHLQNVDGIEVAYFQGKQVADLQAHFLDIEIDATTLYSAKVPSTQEYFDLTGTTSSAGAFTGFTMTDGVWAMALRCSACSVPAPLAFAILQPQ
jgi:hypothetical protein